MHNLIKLASIEINKSNDIVKTAGILRLLKNKLLMLFDSDTARDVSKMLNNTSGIKSQLSETYKAIKKIEEAINDLDINEYNANIDILKSKLNELNNSIKNIESIIPDSSDKKEEEQKQELDIGLVGGVSGSQDDKVEVPQKSGKANITNIKREYAPLPEGADIYKGKTTLAQLGVTPADIKPNVNIRQLPSSWAFVEMPKTEEEQQELLGLSSPLLDEEYVKKAFYNKIPDMKIDSVHGREINVQDDEKYGKKGEKKPGYMEVVVVGDFQDMPPPLDNWRLKPKFVLVDYRKKPDDKLKYMIYLKYILKSDKKDKSIHGSKNE